MNNNTRIYTCTCIWVCDTKSYMSKLWSIQCISFVFSVSIFPISTLHNSILFPTAYCFYVHTSKFNSFSLFSIITNFIILFLSVLPWSLLNNSKIFSKHLLYTHVSYSNRVSISMFSISMLHTSMIWRVDAGPGPLMLILSSTSSHRQALLFLVTCRLLVLSGMVVQWIKALVICRSLSFWYIMSSAVV